MEQRQEDSSEQKDCKGGEVCTRLIWSKNVWVETEEKLPPNWSLFWARKQCARWGLAGNIVSGQAQFFTRLGLGQQHAWFPAFLLSPTTQIGDDDPTQKCG